MVSTSSSGRLTRDRAASFCLFVFSDWLVAQGRESSYHTLKPLLTAASKKEDWEQMTARWTLKSIPSQEIVRSEYLPLSSRSFIIVSRSEKPILVLPSRCFC